MSVGCALLGLALLLAADATAGEVLAPFERAGLVPLQPGVCQELRIERAGEGVLEVRFFSEPLLRPTGLDLKTSGASLLLAAEDLERASLVAYDRSGIYARTAQVAAPIRWLRRASDLCIASGTTPVACAVVSGEILGTMRIAFGNGWQTEITDCTDFAPRERSMAAWIAAVAVFAALAGLALRTLQRRRDTMAIALLAASFASGAIAACDPWLLPSVALIATGVIVSALTAAWSLTARRRSPLQRIAIAGLAGFVAFALMRIPHPVWVEHAVEPAVPALWLDAANWHPRAAHQSLDLRGRPLSAIATGAETWLVLGGSVVFGDGVAAEQTFTAIAQERLRAAGDPIVLLNAGAQGWNIYNIDRLAADLTDTLPVTGIVLVSILNNATLPIVAPHAGDCDRSLLHGWFCIVSRSQIVFGWTKAFLPKRSNPQRFRSTLRALLERERHLGRKVVLLDEVAEFDGERLRIWNTDAYRAIAREVAAEFGVPFFPVDDVIASLAPDQRFLDGIHPMPAMHVLLGNRLAEILRER